MIQIRRTPDPTTRSPGGGSLAKILVFLVLIGGLALGFKYFSGRKTGAVHQSINAQICAEQVIAAYISSPQDRKKLFEKMAIKPQTVGEKVERSALARQRMNEDARDPSASLSFPPYKTFRAKSLGQKRYEVTSHVIWQDPATDQQRTISYQCMVTRIGGKQVWDIDEIRLEGVSINDTWNVVGFDVLAEPVDGTWAVRGGKLVLTIRDGSRPVRTVELGPGS